MVVVFLAFWSLQGQRFTWCLGGNGLELVSSSRHETTLIFFVSIRGAEAGTPAPSSPYGHSVRSACAGSIRAAPPSGSSPAPAVATSAIAALTTKGRAPRSDRVYRRYAIADDRDLRMVVEKLDERPAPDDLRVARIALMISVELRPGRFVPNPAFNLADEREIDGVPRHEDKPVISRGRGDQAVVQKAAAESSWAQTSTFDQPSHDERGAHPGRVAGRDDAPEILERSDPILAVLPVVGFVSGASEDLLGNRRVLEEKRRASSLKGRQRRIPLVSRDRLDVQVRVDDVRRHL